MVITLDFDSSIYSSSLYGPATFRGSTLTFDEYQQFTATTAVYTDRMYPVLGLAEEAGEAAGKFAKYVRDNTDFPYEAVKKELGDVMWMVARIAADNGMTLSEVIAGNVNKLKDRQKRSVLHGSGDDR